MIPELKYIIEPKPQFTETTTLKLDSSKAIEEQNWQNKWSLEEAIKNS